MVFEIFWHLILTLQVEYQFMISTALAPTAPLDVILTEVTDSDQEGIGQKQMMQSRTEF